MEARLKQEEECGEWRSGIKYCKQSLCEQFKIEQFKIAGAAENNSKLKTQNSKFTLRNIVHTVKKCYKQKIDSGDFARRF